MMTWTIRAAFAALAMLASTAGLAVEPADADIKAALYDIDRYEKQFEGVTQARASNVNRTLKLLGVAKQRLDASPNKSHPSWQEAATRYNALIEKLNGLLGGGTSAAAAPPPPPTPSTPAQPAQSARPAAAAPTQAPQMISQQRVRVNKLNRDIQSATQTMDQGGPKPFQDPAYVKQAEDRAARFAQSLAAYDQFADDPDVQAARASLDAYNQMLAFGKQLGADANSKLGDVQGRLKAMEERMRGYRVPEGPQAPYEDDAIGQWFDTVARVRALAAQDLPQLEQIRAEASLPLTRGTVQQGAAYDMQDVDRLIRSHQDNERRIRETQQQLELNLGAQAGEVERILAFIDGLDPSDTHARSNSFLGEGNQERIHEQIAQQKKIAEGMLTYAQRTGSAAVAQFQQLIARTDQTRAGYDAKRREALQLSRMPEPATNERDLRRIAEETIANPKYGVGEVKRLVINTEKVQRTKETSEVEIDEVDVALSGKVTLSGTETTTFYEWEEFQVATAEPVGDKHYIFYNTLKFFTRGATTTPLNRWVMSGRIQGDEILAENIDR